MPISGIPQPALLAVDDTLRLRAFDGCQSLAAATALAWYQDPETVFLVDGVRRAYDRQALCRMYTYLDAAGELYWIELLRNGAWCPVGDVTFWQQDMPIVLGEKDLRGHGVGRRVVAVLTQRGRQLGYDALYVREIYAWNTASQRCFAAAGFRPYETTEKGARWRLEL